jgi:hypothetical protein
MFKNLSTETSEHRPAPGRWASGLALVAVLLATGCEDKGIGRPCELPSDAGTLTPTQGGFSVLSPDCPSHICIKPAVQAGVAVDNFTTGAYCTAQCNSDSDCNGQTRDFSNAADTRCKQGFTCAIPFDKDKLCCTKLCLCRDFFPSSVGPLTPAGCASDAPASCS